MKPFHKSIIGSFRMPEANPEEWCPVKTDYGHVSYSLGPIDMGDIEQRERGEFIEMEDSDCAGFGLAPLKVESEDFEIRQTENECLRHISACSECKEGPPARLDSKGNAYVTYAWKGSVPRELSDQFLAFMQGMHTTVSAVKPEGEATAKRKVMCEIRCWPEIIKDGDTYSMWFRASFYPEG